MAVTYRTTGPWGAGSASDLPAATIDENFWTLVQEIITLTSEISGSVVSIASATVVGNQLTFTLTNSAVLGPYTLPVAQWNWRGPWQPLTTYAIQDVITDNASVYLVIWNHTSAATFNPGANDGLGHNYYALLLTIPGSALPAHGSTNQVLAKINGTDFNTYWATLTLEYLEDVQHSPGPANGDLIQYESGLWRFVEASSLALLWSQLTGTIPYDSLRNPTVTVLGTSGSVALDPSLGDVFTVIPTGNITLDALFAPADAKIVVIITTSGSADHTITLGTLFATADVIHTGTTSGVDITLTFTGDGSNLYSTGRSSVVAQPADYQADNPRLTLTTDSVWGAAVPVTLTDAGTISMDFSTFINAFVTLGGNRTLGTPANVKPGQSGLIEIDQDSTGTRTLTLGSGYLTAGGAGITLSTAPNARDAIAYTVLHDGDVLLSLQAALA
jgi:hypothetical protein